MNTKSEGSDAKVTVCILDGSRAFQEVCGARIPLIRRTFPDPEPGWPVTITKRDRFFRANGKIIPGNFARYLMRAGGAL